MTRFDRDSTDSRHAPWSAWSSADLVGRQDEVFVSAGELTTSSTYKKAVSDLNPQLFKEVLLSRCMRKWGFFIVRGISPSANLTDDMRDLGQLLKPSFELVQQEKTGYEIMEIKDAIGQHEQLPFHTDAGQFLGLLCTKTPNSGADTLLLSSLKIHDILEGDHPETLRLLRRHWKFHRGNRPGPTYYEWPVFREDTDFGLSCYFLPNTLNDTPRRIGEPLDRDRVEALSTFHEVLKREELAWKYEMQQGDFLVLCNKKILHSRSSYSAPDGSPGRRLLRAWINLPRSELSHDAPAY